MNKLLILVQKDGSINIIDITTTSIYPISKTREKMFS